MATMITVHGDHAADVAGYLNNRLEVTVVDRPDDCEPHVLTALDGVIITQVDRADPDDPRNSELMETLERFGGACLACACYYKLLDVISRVGTTDQYDALVQLIELHDLECWGSPPDEDDDDN